MKDYCQTSQCVQTVEEPFNVPHDISSIHEFIMLEETLEEPLEGQLKLSIHRGKAFTDHLFEVSLVNDLHLGPNIVFNDSCSMERQNTV